MTWKPLSAAVPVDLKKIFEHMRRRKDCFEVRHNTHSMSFRCKYCGQRWRLRLGPSGLQPGKIDEMFAHADQHLLGHSMATH